MISRCFRFFLFLPLLLLVTVPALARQTPEAVLKEIQTAIDASDLAAFERRVDVDALLDQSSSALIAALQKAGQVDTSGLPPMLALMVASVQDPSRAKQIKGSRNRNVHPFRHRIRLFRRKTQSQRKTQRPARTAFRQRLHGA